MDCKRGEHKLVEGCGGINAKTTEIQVVGVVCLPFLCLGYSNIAPFMTYQKRVLVWPVWLGQLSKSTRDGSSRTIRFFGIAQRLFLLKK
jgi:hypothetical protein